MLTESYSKVATYLTNTFGTNFILFTILLTTAASIVYFVVISYSITQMDTRYFLSKEIPPRDAIQTHQLSKLNNSLSYLVKVVKIIAGVCLLIFGILMLVLPGQGLITMIIGLSLLPFPGKDKMEKNLLSRKSVRSTLNWIRTKANKEPFIFD